MGLFKRFIKKSVEEAQSFKDSIETEIEVFENEEVINQEEWVWIEGYKGTKTDMTCKGFQFDFNKEYIVDGIVEICGNGFHFCKNLTNVFSFYELNPHNRFFKVKALVKKSDLEKSKDKRAVGVRNLYLYSNDYTDDKYVAKKIIFLEEVSFEELLVHIQRKYDFVENENDWNLIRENGYKEFKRRYFFNQLKGVNFSETFLTIIFNKIDCSKSSIRLTCSYMRRIIDFIKAMNDEGVSKDMAVYLILEEINSMLE